VLIHADDPLLVSHRITGWALERGLELRGFSVQRPTLEDVYLRLTAATEEA
jgi:ABC-2 type transport system ATP-binding protein